ncbi:DUF3631 domain-containing protein [Streptomyces sp. URMC 129]|uniref:DUF3631 domain-containing protein n=1 Tax=Streptomyces sp. URMC 129 TaxID=3423407 RepID=UPI003F1DF773
MPTNLRLRTLGDRSASAADRSATRPPSRSAGPEGQRTAPLSGGTVPGPSPSSADRSPRSADGGSDGPADRTVPAPGPGAELLDDLRRLIARYVILPNEQALDAVVLWTAATHLQDAFQHAPRLAILGPVKRCGKSRLLDVVTETVHRPVITVNASAAAIFRSITSRPPTLLVDEADTLFGSVKAAERNEDLRGLLNAGHQRNRPTLRIGGPEQKVMAFPTFAMAALAGIGDLPDTIMDRAIVVRMRRRAPGETVASFRTRRDVPELHALREQFTAWSADVMDEAARLEPHMPVEDRAADTWEPLIAVADLAGGHWPERARAACRSMTAAEEAQERETGLGTRLLADIRRAFTALGDPPALPTTRLIAALRDDPEAPWAEYGLNGLTPRGLQLLLRDHGISSSNIRFPDGNQAKGFTRNKFTDAWLRYCAEPPPADR